MCTPQWPARQFAEAVGDPKPDPLKYPDPIVFALDLNAWHLRQAERERQRVMADLAMFPDVNQEGMLRYQFDGPGEGENR